MKEYRHHSVEEFQNLFLNQAGFGLPVYHGQSVQLQPSAAQCP